VGQSLGHGDVVARQRIGDLGGRGTLLLHELTKELQVELAVAADPAQAILGIETFHGGDVFRAGGGNCGPRRPCDDRGVRRLIEPAHRLDQQLRIDRLGHMVVHAGIEATLAFFHGGMRSHGDDGQADESRV
jgi:hypothetical protein